MNRSKALSLLPFASCIALFAYLFLLYALEEPRAQDLALDESEICWFESLWLTYSLFGMIYIWIRSMWRSYQAHQLGWLCSMLFIWPSAALYVWSQE